MSTFVRKSLAILFLVVFFVPVLLMALAVEAVNFAMLELTGRAMWNVGHVAEIYRSMQAMNSLKSLDKLFSALKKASGDDGGPISGGSVPNTPRNFN